MASFMKRLVYLTEEQLQTLFSTGTLTVDGRTITYSDDDMYVTPQPTPLYMTDIGSGLALSGGKVVVAGKLDASQKGAIDGVAELGHDGKVPSSQLPSYVDDVLEYAALASFPATGETGKIYVALDTNKIYRWSGSTYIEISSSLALGETSGSAYRGDRGAAAYAHASAKGTEAASGFYKITTNAEGHVTAVTPVEKTDITALGVPAQDTTYSAATRTVNGLMTAEDKTKLDGIDGINTYYVAGSDTDEAGVWTGTINGLTAYYDGLNIIYVNGVVGKSGGSTLNINGLGDIPCYFIDNGSQKVVTTHYPVGTPIKLTYVDGRFISADYTRSNTTTISNLVHGNGSYVAHSAVYRYQMLFQVDEDTLTPLNNVSNGYSNVNKAMLTDVAFDPFGRIFYYGTTTAVAANVAIGAGSLFWSTSAVDLRYSFNLSASVDALTAHKNVFLKVVPRLDGMAKLAEGFPLVQDLPVVNDGHWYIFLGRAYNETNISLYPQHKVYAWDGMKYSEVARTKILEGANIVDFSGYAAKNNPVITGSITLGNTTMTEQQLASVLDVMANITDATGVSF